MKTLIELFDSCQLENVVAGLGCLPEKIIFVGFKKMMSEKKKSDLKRFFDLKGIDISLEFEIVGRYNFDEIRQKLEYITERNEDCCFDLTGGEEMVLTAMGVVATLRNIPVIQFNVRTGELIRVMGCDDTHEPEKMAMTIKECVTLHGGAIVSGGKDENGWKLTDDFKRDIEKMWELCSPNCGLWNRQSGVLECFEKFGSVDDNLCVTANLKWLREENQDVILNRRIMTGLVREGLICEFEADEETVKFRYKNNQVRRCLSKAGNILELYAFMTVEELRENEGVYDDTDIGVFVDWDGVIYGEESDKKETRNEIDVIVMKGLIPIFVSCKNGEVRKEALYELNTVAEKFGGEYAKKVLLTTYVSSDAESRKYIMQRARDMKIDIIEGVDDMSRGEFKEILKQRLK